MSSVFDILTKLGGGTIPATDGVDPPARHFQGLPIESDGSLSVDTTSSVSYHFQSLPHSSSGRLCAGVGADYVSGGLQFSSDGRVVIPGDSPEPPAFSPQDLFSSGELGWIFLASSPGTLYQQDNLVDPVTSAGQTVLSAVDQSPNEGVFRPGYDDNFTYQTSPERLVSSSQFNTYLNYNDDSPFLISEATMLIASTSGVLCYKSENIPDSLYHFYLEVGFKAQDVVACILVSRILTDQEVQDATQWIVENSAAPAVLFDGDMSYSFDGYSYGLTEFYHQGFDTSGTTNLEGLFEYKADIEKVVLTDCDFSSCSSFRDMFTGCTSLEYADLSNWTFGTSPVSFRGFAGLCPALTTLDLSGWSGARASTLYRAFRDTKVSSIDLSVFDLQDCTSMEGALQNCVNVSSVDLTGLDLSSCASLLGAFQGCSSLTQVVGAEAFSALPLFSGAFCFAGCGLDQTSVDSLLSAFEATPHSGRTIDISGGTSATPSASGQASADALRARGWTVNLNGY